MSTTQCSVNCTHGKGFNCPTCWPNGRPEKHAKLVAAELESQIATGIRHVLHGRSFRVMARFPDTDQGARDANDFMEKNPGASVLEVVGGEVILASNEDKGLPISRAV